MRRAALIIVLVPLTTFATPAGISGFSGKTAGSTCGACHTGGAAPTVTVTGPGTLAAGATGSYTVTVAGTGVNAGFDAALSGANAATAAFQAGTGTKVLNGELVQSAAKTFAGGSAVFTFSVKAPASTGMLTINVAGLSSNANLSPDGDGAAVATLDVMVGTVAPTPDAGVTPPGVDAGTAAKPDAGTALHPAPQNPKYQTDPLSDGLVEGEAGCSSAGGAPLVMLALLLFGAVLIRRPAR